eukprot:gnl/MRDRNA2_/MRDRNA2_125595_c0_seq1.p1 gnl/MRDRNA2_/MRDRNA2_125595_c0~~gnl/MRDRNA2_/MRDRNA2_125595_c0_seq1.p1  ORF type:complete len:134 (+),score=20.09 gnl/MRDRNA2_/MRDRNA2_125595_c0_seq1:290-691(+)
MANLIKSRALETLEVHGTEYPPTPLRATLSQALFYFQIGLFILIFAGEHIFEYFKVREPEWFRGFKDNKLASFMMIWFMGSMMQTQLLSTGAFEIWHGKTLIWSSLENKRLPQIADIVRGFKKTGVEFMLDRR